MTRILVALALIPAAACGGGGSSASHDLAVDMAESATIDLSMDRLLGEWPSCTFGHRLQFTTPANTDDDAQNNITGSVFVSVNADGTVAATPTSTDATFCALDFTRDNESEAQIVAGSHCGYDGLDLAFTATSYIDASTLQLAGVFKIAFTGTYNNVAASGNGTSVYTCAAR